MGFSSVTYMLFQSGLMREAKISVQFAHPNVLPAYGIARVNGRVAAISPWMRNGNVMDYLRAHKAADRLQMASVFTHGSGYPLIMLSLVLRNCSRSSVHAFFGHHSRKPQTRTATFSDTYLTRLTDNKYNRSVSSSPRKVPLSSVALHLRTPRKTPRSTVLTNRLAGAVSSHILRILHIVEARSPPTSNT